MNNVKTSFTIKDLENITGIKAHTIRIWEKRYGLLHPKRSEGNFRNYSIDGLLKLLNVALLKKYNHKISKIAEMSEEAIKTHAQAISKKYSSVDYATNAFKVSMYQFDKVLFNEAYDKLAQEKTFREIFHEVFIPFLHYIGMLWHTNSLLPAHEHFISNLIMRKIQINTEKLQYTTTNKNKMYVLFLPMNEIHEIGLQYLNYELVMRGCQTIYLGQSLPLNNLQYFFEGDTEITFVCYMTFRPYNEEVTSYFSKVDEILKNTNHSFIAVGCKTKDVNVNMFKSKIKTYQSLEDILKFLG